MSKRPTPGQGWPGVTRTPKLSKTAFLIVQSFEMGHVGVQEALGMPQLECHLEPRLVELWWNPGWWNFGGTLVELWWNLGWWNPTLLEVELWWNIGGTLVEPGLVEPNLGGTRPAKKCIFLNCDPSPNCTPLGGHPWQGLARGGRDTKITQN